MSNTTLYPHVYLSPHLDDAVLSCGGRIWHRVKAGEGALVVTVFAGSPDPDGPLSPFAQGTHADWKLAADAPAARREEDRAALAILGAAALHWHYADCIYRQAPDGHFPYASEEALFGEMHPVDEALVTELAGRIAALPLAQAGTLYVPVGVGGHVDHRIVRRAVAEVLVPSGFGHPVVYYEDYPYAEKPEAVQAALAQGRWQTELAPLSEEAVEAKIAAIACYRSQLDGLGWPQAADVAAAVRAFAERTGGGELAERYWRAAPSGARG